MSKKIKNPPSRKASARRGKKIVARNRKIVKKKKAAIKRKKIVRKKKVVRRKSKPKSVIEMSKEKFDYFMAKIAAI